MRKFVPVFLVILSLNIFGQNSNYETRGYGKTLLCDAGDFFQTGIDLIAQPFVWNKNDWLYFGGTLGVTAAFFLIDEPVRDFALKNQSKTLDAIFLIDDWITGARSLILPSAVYFYGFLARNRSVRSLGLKSAEALIYASAITFGLKIAFGRYRPYNEKGNLAFEPFTNNEANASLPSGHATAAFALATVFASAYDNLYWEIFCYGAASVIAFARVYHDKHWVSDIFLGSAIGYSVGKFVANRKVTTFQFGSVRFSPYFSGASFGVFGRF